MGYFVAVAGGRLESGCQAFAVTRGSGLVAAAFGAVTTAEQFFQGDTRGRPAGAVQGGQRNEITDDDDEEDDERPPSAVVPLASATSTPSPTLTTSPAPSATGTATATVTPTNTATTTPTPTSTPVSCTFSIDDVTQVEGDSDKTAFVFTVTLSTCSSRAQVHVELDEGTAQQAQDYDAQGGQELVFNPGETTQTYSVHVRGDTDVEPDETFFVVLSNPKDAIITDDTGVGTILNDDAPFVDHRPGSDTRPPA